MIVYKLNVKYCSLYIKFINKVIKINSLYINISPVKLKFLISLHLNIFH